ncbi:dehydrogenase with different specificitie [Pseudovirgaria hyperparasitica]|uniref:Dehydrogenase with different specificitie n=1 Tax=Pseudovirgaria hyperparasitica TaxID=470096 RepID=A0A6A6WF95_9PEZI|nr:dehydrogenase with different specificitie [Pseudovirgaria hyperparasitica]KAF2761498.1 dehydrogenase with different specificitie [Pseudovirgaria hyperparasitica]
MTSEKARQRLTMLSEQLAVPAEDPGMFEDIPKIRRIAGDSAGQRTKGKVVIITGTNSAMGIGRATAHQFAHNGARAVYLCDYDDEHLPVHKRELESLYPEMDVHIRQFDAAEEEAVKNVVQEALDKYGRLDVFFANAGRASGSVFTDIDADDWMEMMRVNTLSVFLAAKYGAKAMLKTSKDKPYPCGSIIGTASVAGIRSNAGSTDYSASKAAVVSIAQTVSYQLAGTGIRCNAICPGVIETGMTKPMYDAARAKGTQKKIGQLNPLKRGAAADEVARVALFLGSDESSYVNGQAWAVCGGLSAGHPFVPGKMA